MGYSKKCMHCGAYLDPGERCDCEQQKTACPSLPIPKSQSEDKKPVPQNP